MDEAAPLWSRSRDADPGFIARRGRDGSVVLPAQYHLCVRASLLLSPSWTAPPAHACSLYTSLIPTCRKPCHFCVSMRATTRVSARVPTWKFSRGRGDGKPQQERTVRDCAHSEAAERNARVRVRQQQRGHPNPTTT